MDQPHEDHSTNIGCVDRQRQLDKFIEELKTKRRWFIQRRIQLQCLWITLTITTLTLGFLTSILIALGFPHEGKSFEKVVLEGVVTR